jgi:hypothetical protein
MTRSTAQNDDKRKLCTKMTKGNCTIMSKEAVYKMMTKGNCTIMTKGNSTNCQ